MILQHLQFSLYQKMVFEKVVVAPPQRVAFPMPNEACFFYVLRGEQRVQSSVQQLKVQPKEAVLMRCGLYFGEWLQSLQSDQSEAIAVHLYPDILKKIYDRDFPDLLKSIRESETKAVMTKIVDDELLRRYIDTVNFYFENPALVDDELIVLKLKELILLLAKTENAPSIRQILTGLFTPREYGFKEIVEAHLYSALSIDELAQLANMSSASFKREFGKVYHASPARYFRTKRLERAADLLAHTDQEITAIAFDCGFNNSTHFSRAFQSKYSVSPSHFRLSRKSKSLR